MLYENKHKTFANGQVFSMLTEDNYPVEVTDTFLPYYTVDACNRSHNKLANKNYGDRSERWMIGVSTMSGCPVGCKFCATGQLKKYRNLSAEEIYHQISFITGINAAQNPLKSKEFKINYTRMGEPFLNIDSVKQAIGHISNAWPNTHHYISTIGIKGSDLSWIKGNITLQISLHSTDVKYRNWLIPYSKKMSLEELGQIRTNSNRKTTINLTLVRENDFDINILKKYFDPKYFFIKLSPINKNTISECNDLGDGVIIAKNIG